MKKQMLLFLAIELTASFANAESTPVPNDVVTINPSVSWGSWDGWGVSFAWWAKVFGDRKDVADMLYTTGTVNLEGQKLPGLGLTIARYNAGACSENEVDGRKMVVSKIITPFRQIEGFWLDGKSADPQSPNWDWRADANQRAMLLMARERGANRFELFSNSPMWWMCANNNPSGAAIKTADNLPSKNYEKFATYLATITAYAKAHWGIAFTSVEPFNEPISGWWFDNCKQEGAYFSQRSQQAFLPILRSELDRQGLKGTHIAASDETNYDQALKTWTSFNASTHSLVDQVNVHGYQGVKGPRAALYAAVVERDKKPLWNSEYGDKFADGLEMARCLNLDLAHLHPTAWCYWQALDGGNNGGWGLLGGDLVKKTIATANPKYFVLAQYTRHLRPGMTILESGAQNTVAAYDPTTHRLVLVAFNDGPAREATYDLSRFASARDPITRWLTEPLAATRYAPQPSLSLAGKTLKAVLPADSIQTFEIEGVSLR